VTAPKDKAARAAAQTRTFAEILATADATHAAHDAACTAYGQIEARVFAGEVAKDDPAYVAAEAAEGEACAKSTSAWADLMEAEAPNLVAALAQLRAFHDRSALFPFNEPDRPVHGHPVDADEALKRVVRNLLRRLRRLRRRPTPTLSFSPWAKSLSGDGNTSASW
jgi:hypothetical protein